MSSTHTHAAPAFIAGLPHPLPAGESLRWQGAPDARAIARHVFHQRKLAAYFAAMLVLWTVTSGLAPSDPAFPAAFATRAGAALLALAIVEALARVVARTTWYAITDKRVVLRIGMVLPMSINIPFSRLVSGAVAVHRDGSGQVALELGQGHRIAYIALWPHCRVFALNQPVPVMRGLADPRAVGAILADAVRGADSAPALDVDAHRAEITGQREAALMPQHA